MMFTSDTIKRQSCDHRKVKGKVRAPMLDGGTDVRCEHQCKQQWAEMATDEYIIYIYICVVCCFCCVASVVNSVVSVSFFIGFATHDESYFV